MPGLAIPDVRAGDRGLYTVTYASEAGHAIPTPPGAWTTMRFAWGGPTHVLDAQGLGRAVIPLELAIDAAPGGEWGWSWSTLDIDVTTHEAVRQTFRFPDHWNDPLLGPAPQLASHVDVGATRTRFAAAGFLCGLLHSGQGTTLQPGGEITAAGTCRAQAQPTRFTSVEGEAGLATFVVKTAEGDGELHLMSGLAYPVLVRTRVHLTSLSHPVVATYTLDAFDPSRTAPTTPPALTLPDPLEWGPWDPLTGPDIRGIEFAFPLPAAVAAARANPASGLPGFLAAHPSAFLLAANSRSESWLGTERYDWFLTFTDGRDTRVFFVERMAPGPSSGAGGLAVVAVDRFSDWARRTPDGVGGSGTVPARFVTPGSVVARMQAYANLASPQDPWATTYGFSLGPATDRGTNVTLWAGVDKHALDPARTGNSTRVRLTVGADGDALWLDRYDEQHDELAPRATGRVSDDRFRDGSLWTAQLPAFGIRETALGFGGAAFIAFLAYALWASKAGPLGALFSRTHPDAALQQATRRRIYELVQCTPGIHFTELRRQSATGKGGLAHHLRVLQQARLIEARKQGQLVCYIPTQLPGLSHAAAHAEATRSRGAQAVLVARRRNPTASARAIGRETGFAASTVAYHLRRLEEARFPPQSEGPNPGERPTTIRLH